MDWFPSNWQEFAAFITVVQFIVVIIALIYARQQMKEATSSRKLLATTQLLNEIGAPHIRKARDYVFYRLKPISHDLSSISEEDLDTIRSVAVAYDRVGYMIKQGLMPEKALFDFQCDEIDQLWQKIGRVITDFQQERKRPHYCENFVYLATKWLPEMRSKHS